MNISSRWRQRVPRLGVRGVAAVEFAICLPFLVFLMIGTVEFALLYRTEAKLNTFAGNFAQMVALQEITSISSSGVTSTHSPVPITGTNSLSGLTDLCTGAVYGLQPFSPLGLTVNIASVTQVAAAKYDEWEVDMNNNCAAQGTQLIGATAAKATATGSGTSTALVQAIGDNAIIVTAKLQYPGIIGFFLTSAQTLSQTAIARWRYASASNITNVTATPAPSTSLEFSCSGTGCVSNNAP